MLGDDFVMIIFDVCNVCVVCVVCVVCSWCACDVFVMFCDAFVVMCAMFCNDLLMMFVLIVCDVV